MSNPTRLTRDGRLLRDGLNLARTGHGPTWASLAERPSPPKGEEGFGGLPSFGGRIAPSAVDAVAEWQPPARWRNIGRMRHDADVAAVLSAIALPVLASELRVVPGSEDEKDKQIADIMWRDLNNMTTDLAQFRREATLGSPCWGNRVFEVAWPEHRGEDGLWHPRKIALRQTDTISDWGQDDNGGPTGVWQLKNDGRPQFIEIDRLVVFVYDREGGSLIGNPLTRNMFGPWLLKNGLEKIGAAAIERHGLGIPTILYKGKDESIATRYEEILMGLHAHEQAYVLLRELESMGDFEVKGLTGTAMDPLPQMQFHRQAIYQSALCQFLMLGTGDVGSYALSEDQSSFFMLAEDALVKMLDATLNRYLVPKWVSYNWTIPAERMPRIEHQKMNRRNVEAWFRAVQIAALVPGIRLDPFSLSAMAGSLLGVEAANEEGHGGMAPVADVNAEPKEGEEEPTVEYRRKLWAGAAGQPLKSEAIIDQLGIRSKLLNLAQRMDKAEAKMVDGVGSLQQKRASYLATLGAKVVKANDAEAVAKAVSDMPHQQEDDLIYAELVDLYGFSEEEADSELSGQGIKVQDPDSEEEGNHRSFLKSLAIAAGALLASRMAANWQQEVLRQMRYGLDEEVLRRNVSQLSLKLLQSLASQAASHAVAMGRDAVFGANVDGIDHYVMSSLLDGNTCIECQDLDGQTFAPGDEPLLPYEKCLGRDRCRCEKIAVAKGES